MSSMPSNVAAHATATSAPDHPVWFHGSRGENLWSLLGVWHRGNRSVQDIVDQIHVTISSPGGIAEGVLVPTLRTSSALTPSTGQGRKNGPSPKWLQTLSFRNPRMFPSGPPILEIQLVYLGWLENVKFPLCISFLYLNSLCIIWLHLLWCLLLLHFRYSKISVENKTRPRLQDDERNWDQ